MCVYEDVWCVMCGVCVCVCSDVWSVCMCDVLGVRVCVIWWCVCVGVSAFLFIDGVCYIVMVVCCIVCVFVCVCASDLDYVSMRIDSNGWAVIVVTSKLFVWNLTGMVCTRSLLSLSLSLSVSLCMSLSVSLCMSLALHGFHFLITSQLSLQYRAIVLLINVNNIYILHPLHTHTRTYIATHTHNPTHTHTILHTHTHCYTHTHTHTHTHRTPIYTYFPLLKNTKNSPLSLPSASALQPLTTLHIITHPERVASHASHPKRRRWAVCCVWVRMGTCDVGWMWEHPQSFSLWSCC